MKKLIFLILIANFVYGYKVDGLSSGTNAEKILQYLIKEGNYGKYSTVTITDGLQHIINDDEYFLYKKTIFGHKAEIEHYFTRKSHILYKTIVSWSLNEQGTAFINKLTFLLSKKYKKLSSNTFLVDKYSIVKIINDTTDIKLVYIDKRFLKKSKKEQSKYKKEQSDKEFKKALKEL